MCPLSVLSQNNPQKLFQNYFKTILCFYYLYFAKTTSRTYSKTISKLFHVCFRQFSKGSQNHFKLVRVPLFKSCLKFVLSHCLTYELKCVQRMCETLFELILLSCLNPFTCTFKNSFKVCFTIMVKALVNTGFTLIVF